MDNMMILNIIFAIYVWAIQLALLYFILAIARFYETKSEQRTYYWLFLIPMLTSTVTLVRYVGVGGTITGDVIADLARCVGGVVTIGMGFNLLRQMIGGRV